MGEMHIDQGNSPLVDKNDLQHLFHFFASCTCSSNPQDQDLLVVQNKVNSLLKKTYQVSLIDNFQKSPDTTLMKTYFYGYEEVLCSTYPLNIPIIEKELNSSAPSKATADGLRPLFQDAKLARVRTRFPVPVILVNSKFICRSSTLAQQKEIAYNRPDQISLSNYLPYQTTPNQTSVVDEMRKKDIELLKRLKVTCICDLMVENKKAILGGMVNVASSEKTDSKNRYSEFSLNSLPYPGVEFFSEFKNLNHKEAEKLYYDWNGASEVNPYTINNLYRDLWQDYQNCNLVLLSQNYFRYLLRLLHTEDGMLIHCISGWDRTPLFISLLRLSLWADGKIHQNLNAEEILYLTIAYDWLLFSHQFVDRTQKGQDIFKFCFYFLDKIVEDQYSFDNCLPPKESNDDSVCSVASEECGVLPKGINIRTSHSPENSCLKSQNTSQKFTNDHNNLNNNDSLPHKKNSSEPITRSHQRNTSKSSNNNNINNINNNINNNNINNINNNINSTIFTTSKSPQSPPHFQIIDDWLERQSSSSSRSLSEVQRYGTSTSPTDIPIKSRSGLQDDPDSLSSLGVGSWTALSAGFPNSFGGENNLTFVLQQEEKEDRVLTKSTERTDRFRYGSLTRESAGRLVGSYTRGIEGSPNLSSSPSESAIIITAPRSRGSSISSFRPPKKERDLPEEPANLFSMELDNDPTPRKNAPAAAPLKPSERANRLRQVSHLFIQHEKEAFDLMYRNREKQPQGFLSSLSSYLPFNFVSVNTK